MLNSFINSFDYSNENLSSCPNDFSCNDIHIEERIQISIITDSDTICDLLSTLECEKISLNGYSYLNLHDNCNLFNFVVGNNEKQTSNDVRTVECLLNKWCIDYVSSKILKIYLPSYSKNIFRLLIQRKYITLSPDIDHQLLLFTAGTSKRSPSEHKKVLGKTSRASAKSSEHSV